AYEQAARLATAPSIRVEWLTAAADAHFAAGDYAQAAALLEPLADSVEDPVAQARIALLLGSVELWLRGPSVAMPRFEVSALRVRATDPNLDTQLMLHASTARLVMLDLPGAQSPVTPLPRARGAPAPPAGCGATAPGRGPPSRTRDEPPSARATPRSSSAPPPSRPFSTCSADPDSTRMRCWARWASSPWPRTCPT